MSTGKGTARGLGTVSASYLNFHGPPGTSCELWRSNPVLVVSGRGDIDLAVTTPTGSCVDGAGSSVRASLAFSVTGGSGIYAGASGSGTFLTVGSIRSGDTDTLDGPITVPGLDFDLVPPTFSGATSKTVRAPKRAKRVRVTYKVKAQDDIDGPVAITCSPPSGSKFKIGRTKVTCSATDSSANTAIASFTVTVKHR